MQGKEEKDTSFLGRRGRIPKAKGRRQSEPEALKEITEWLGATPPKRDMLIEYLHVLQAKQGYLSARHLASLAEYMGLSQAEIYETASFYAHFDIVMEGETPPPAHTVRICDGISCMLNGAVALEASLKQSVDASKIRVVQAPCMGRCDQAPVAEVGHRHIAPSSSENIMEAIGQENFSPVFPKDALLYDLYVEQGGYRYLSDCRAGKNLREKIIEIMQESGLRGLGGAGFPTGQKWQFVAREAEPRLMAINADEGEPGTFKDHYYLKRDPHRFLEGALIAAWVVGAEKIYLYLRDEYPDIQLLLEQEIALLEKAGLLADCQIILRRGAGAYICGEESAMLESLEGKRGLPRHKPPFPSQSGLFGRPTLIHNVETVFWVREILEKGAEWFNQQGMNGRTGLRSFSVSGRVRDTGVKCAPAGISVQQLIDEYCGGMLKGHDFKAYLPGGASGGLLPSSMADIPLDFDTLQPHGCFIGSAAIVVFSDQDQMLDVALNLMRFFLNESCGQCTPCRLGTEKALNLMEEKKWNLPLIEELMAVMRDASICGLGQAAPNPVDCLIKYFPEEIPK